MSNSSILHIAMTLSVLPLWARVVMAAMAMKEYFGFFKAPGLEPNHQMV